LVLVNKNYLHLPEMIKLARSFGVQAVFAEPITVYTELGEELKISTEDQEQLNKTAQQAVILAEKYKIPDQSHRFYQGIATRI